MLRSRGADAARRTVEAYHRLSRPRGREPGTGGSVPREEPTGSSSTSTPSTTGRVGVVDDQPRELQLGRRRGAEPGARLARLRGDRPVILTGDFHLATQMVGADTSDFFPSLSDPARRVALGELVADARRLHTDFATSRRFVNGKPLPRRLPRAADLTATSSSSVESASLGGPSDVPRRPRMEGPLSFRKSRPEGAEAP